MESNLSQILQSQGTRFVRILWCDNANVIRGKAFHVGFLSEHQDHGIGISMAQQAIPVMYDAVAAESGLGPVGEVWLTPDWSTLTALPYAVGHARVMGDIVHQGQPWALCPRSFLKRMIAQAAEMGLQIKAAFEHEFYLLRSPHRENGLALPTHPDAITPVDQTVFASTLGMDLNQPVIDDIAEALLSQGIPVERYYPESGPGQHELSIRYTHALQAADWQIAFRETVRGVALRHGLRASFLPKIFANHAGSGCHLHLSLWQNGQNISSDPHSPSGLSQPAIAFIAGILEHLPALMAITTPSVNSYRRLQPHCWSGAFRCWGLDNREAAVRVPSNPVGAPTHIELKTVDASANPYLALGGAIAAGLDGIRRGLEPGQPVTVDPGYIPEDERLSQGISRLPTNLGEAIAHLSQNEMLLNALGTKLAQAFLAVRRAEWQALKEMELEDEVRLLLERY
ncbi:MAG: glutamine synthetase family protein [Oculatellaceae cyanobacterium bins.114]|nr:glutamine synthetase family protein [Oculatellaceae cyanobacterium bins.114]